ncbi:MAG: patatin-like phospholipase family protein [Planctomycetia bacterium]|nr:patatin-like phospholipase family protein [Planctomycetia bacterium]
MTCHRISLALGGGGARGIAHLGVIAGLEESGFGIERLVGVSIGSLAGALYAFDPDIHRVQRRIVEYLYSSGFRQFQRRLNESRDPGNRARMTRATKWHRLTQFLRATYVCQQVLLQQSVLPGDVLRHAVEHLLPDADIADARVPLSIVAVDLLQGLPVTLERGSVRDAVRGSASIPGVFPPVVLDGTLLCDIGVLNSLPTLATRSYPTGCLVGVDVSSPLQPITTCQTAVDVLVRMNDVGESMFRRQVFAAADFVIRPEVGMVPWFDFSGPSRLMQLGQQAALEAVPSIAARCCDHLSTAGIQPNGNRPGIG